MFSFGQSSVVLAPPEIPIVAADILPLNLHRLNMLEISVDDTLRVDKQDADNEAMFVPGDAVSIMTSDGFAEGNIYILNGKPTFICERVIGPTGDDLESRVLKTERSKEAYARNEWFEDVYPIGHTPTSKEIEKILYPLANYASKSGAFFVAIVTKGAVVVMPASMNKSVWENGASKRYAQYANMVDSDGNIATNTVVVIDPGDSYKDRYTNTEQIGLMDRDIPPGQTQIDLSVDDRVEEICEKAIAYGAIGRQFRTIVAEDRAYDRDWETESFSGGEIEIISSAETAQIGTSWSIPK